MKTLDAHRAKIRSSHLAPENEILQSLIRASSITNDMRAQISEHAAEFIEHIRASDDPGLMEVFLAEYGLSSDEGVALMCLAEALLRVPDTQTMDDLIEDKISPSSWSAHLGQSTSPLVNASTWGLMLTGKVLKEPNDDGVAKTLHGMVKRLGEPLIRVAVTRAMKEMGHQFVLGETIDEAVLRGKSWQKKGFTYSYDMLGEAALTQKDACEFYKSYGDAIGRLALHSHSTDIRRNPGISIKLSALHPRYEVGQKQRVLTELVPKVLELAIMAKTAKMGFNIDAEEANRLDISLDVIEAVLRSSELKDWDGFGVVVQAYGKRANPVLDWLYDLATECDRKVMVRLVKGAYWDTEIKLAQIEGVDGFPVFTHKAVTDISYMCCAEKLLGMTDRIYPQFATHNAHSVCAILAMADDKESFEFQKLHGMGDALHNGLVERYKAQCRVYAPVGEHKDLLAYLVRRLLENGANSSFVNQIVDHNVSAKVIARDPFLMIENDFENGPNSIPHSSDLYLPERKNSAGWDLADEEDIVLFEEAREAFKLRQWSVGPMIASQDGMSPKNNDDALDIINPAIPHDKVGEVLHASIDDVELAISSAKSWKTTTALERKNILDRAADLYEENAGEIFAILCREAGKIPLDAVSEIREAVDFLRYYSARAIELDVNDQPRGLITCISPWNFPLAIFTGQISAALAAGNGVLAKPAESTPIIATIGIKLLHQAGVPTDVLQLLPGLGSVVGSKLTSDPRIHGVCFTGSTHTAQIINRNVATYLNPNSMLIAETGGLNAMIVDSTALPEQAIKDIVVSAFQSAGQRCSALRLLYLQEDVAGEFLEMLYGAMDELKVGSPWHLSTDIGPIINHDAKAKIDHYVEQAANSGRLLKRLNKPKDGFFVAPSVIKTGGIGDLDEEIFGPVLHVATFKADELEQIVDDINASQYGLTFGLHTRIDDRVETLSTELNVGNIYINRNQIGAVVGSQPFGGEGLSGTGPKAGGPKYLTRFIHHDSVGHDTLVGDILDIKDVQKQILNLPSYQQKTLLSLELPGPTGELNKYSQLSRGLVLCLGPTLQDAQKQVEMAINCGCLTFTIALGASDKNAMDGHLDRAMLEDLQGFDAVVLWSNDEDLSAAKQALAKRNGPIIPLITTEDLQNYCVIERHICIDTTAAGGNASLLAGV
jgi:RHH-type proline utilization regulon transcriptional repressor/proline dehydrogenase/delta 1-pyrroline-5-carboxylate dehydrogenase